MGDEIHGQKRIILNFIFSWNFLKEISSSLFLQLFDSLKGDWVYCQAHWEHLCIHNEDVHGPV